MKKMFVLLSLSVFTALNAYASFAPIPGDKFPLIKRAISLSIEKLTFEDEKSCRRVLLASDILDAQRAEIGDKSPNVITFYGESSQSKKITDVILSDDKKEIEQVNQIVVFYNSNDFTGNLLNPIFKKDIVTRACFLRQSDQNL